MDQAKFAVLDVETTSGDPTSGRVMEVAILALDGNAVRLRWDTLVDPRRPVPHFIRKLTGINDAMVKAAPFFVDVVRTIQTLTEGRNIVAHNARFDMTALEHEFTRQLVPHLDHYNLGSICRYFGISFTSAHRAMNDAEATASLFGKLLAEHGEERILATVSSWPRAIRA